MKENKTWTWVAIIEAFLIIGLLLYIIKDPNTDIKPPVDPPVDPPVEDTTNLSTIEKINLKIGRGFNAWGVTNMGENNAKNAWVNGEYYAIGKFGYGFDNLRLVFYSWDADNEQHLRNMSECIDSTNDNGMIAIIDNHWYPWLRDSSQSRFDYNVKKWYDMWYKTADYLVNNAGYQPDEIVFELINEPYNTNWLMNANDWSNMMQIAVDTIRAAVGHDYAIIVAPYHGLFDEERGIKNTRFPEDTMLILSVHYYEPKSVTQWGLNNSNLGHWYNIEWFRELANRHFDVMESVGFPVTIGEWGVYRWGDPQVPDSTKAKYINDQSKMYKERKFSWSMWDFNTTNGVTTDKYGGTEIKPIFLDAFNNIPERDVKETITSTVYEFQADKTKWKIYSTNGASATISEDGDKLRVDIYNVGNNSLDLRLISPTIPMIKDEIYKLSFKISWEDNNDNNIRQIAGDMDGRWSWVWYENVDQNGFETFEVYYMGYDSDYGNNYNFYLGANETGTLYIHDMKFEKIEEIKF